MMLKNCLGFLCETKQILMFTIRQCQYSQIYESYIINSFKIHMKIQQSGFQIYRFILYRIPTLAFKIFIFILVLLLVIDVSLSFFSKPTFNIQKCLQDYYNQTHILPMEKAEQIMNQKGITKDMNIFLKNSNKNNAEQTNQGGQPNKQEQNTSEEQSQQNISQTIHWQIIKKQDINETFIFTNSSTILNIYMDSSLEDDQCIIQLNYKENDLKPGPPQPVQKIQKNKNLLIGYILSSKFALFFNISDLPTIHKHGLHFHKIIVPQIRTGFRYLWMNVYRNQIDDFVWGMWQSLGAIEQSIKEGWDKQLIEIQQKIKQIQQQNKQQNTKPQQKQKEQNQQKEKNQQKEEKQNNNKIYTQLKLNATKNILQLLNSSSNSIFNSQHSLQYFPTQGHSLTSRSIPRQLAQKQQTSFFMYIFNFFILFSVLYTNSIFLGLFIKYSFITIKGILQIVVMLVSYRNFKRSQPGFINKYTKMMIYGSQNKIILAIQISLSILAVPFFYACICYFFNQIILFGPIRMFLATNPQRQSLFTILLTIEITHFLFFRTRLTLRYFSTFSIVINMFFILIIAKYPFYMSTFIIHLDLICQLLIIWIFLLLQKLLFEQQFDNQHKPCPSKPRMLFFLGYDLDWEHSIPPFWTAFSTWYDISCASTNQRARIDQNYELLYGCLMGMNREEEIPFEEESDDEINMQDSIREMNQEMRPS